MNMRGFISSVALATSVVIGGAHPTYAVSWDAVTDFSITSNPNGPWAYGEGQGGTSFTPYAYADNNLSGNYAIQYWQSVSLPYPSAPYVGKNSGAEHIDNTVDYKPGVLFMHPASSVDTIVQFTAPIPGIYNYNGNFALADTQPTGVIGDVFKNGLLLYTVLLSSSTVSTASFAGLIDLTIGDTLSFAVNSDGDFNHDTTSLTASIATTPLPSTWLMLLSGFLGLGFFAYRGTFSRKVLAMNKPRRLLLGAAFTLSLFTASASHAVVLYDNGPVNGNTNATAIGPTHAVSDSFTLLQAATVTGVNFTSWTDPGFSISAINWEITSIPDVFPVGSSAPVTSVYQFTNIHGEHINSNTFSTGDIPLSAGIYYLVLQNAIAGGTLIDWDMNFGPSLAWNNSSGSIPSESFQILGTTPLPATWILLLFGLAGLGSVTYRRQKQSVAPTASRKPKESLDPWAPSTHDPTATSRDRSFCSAKMAACQI